MKETTIVIPCWIIDNTLLQLTQRCVQAIRDTSDVELILVDNGSLIWSDYLNDEADIIIKFPKNKGYIKAINSGFKLSSGKYLVAGNNDYFMSDGWEKAMQDVLENIPEAGISCLHNKADVKKDIYWEEPGTPGGWWMIKRETLGKIGFLDEIFFNVFGDYDFLWRMRSKLGLRVISTPKVSVEHYSEASLTKFPDRKGEYMHGQWILLDKWKDDPNFIKWMDRNLEITDVEEWLKKNSEYAKSF